MKIQKPPVFTVRKIVVTGILGALSIVLGITGIGFVTWFPGASLTVMHVPVLIGAILEGPLVGALIGFLFGLFSLIQASLIAVNPADIAFTNPLISVLPRLFIGPAAWLIYTGIRGKNFRRIRESIAIVLGSLVGSIVNTGLVLGALGLFQVIPWPALGVIAVTNGPLEAAFAAVLVLIVLLIWKGIPLRGSSRLTRK
ncbi:membrane protein [Spirochaetia bacterium]|nr:membrane protein [Spirochaetia bacterium]GHU34966.1 membrane protein [Spirochaetia bacterium]